MIWHVKLWINVKHCRLYTKSISTAYFVQCHTIFRRFVIHPWNKIERFTKKKRKKKNTYILERKMNCSLYLFHRYNIYFLSDSNKKCNWKGNQRGKTILLIKNNSNMAINVWNVCNRKNKCLRKLIRSLFILKSLTLTL